MRCVLLAALPLLTAADPCCTSPFVCGGCTGSVEECENNKIGCLACNCNCCNPTPPPAPPGVPTPAPASYVIDVAGHTSTVYNPNGSAVVVIYHGLNGLYSPYFALGDSVSKLGYAVVIPHDCSGGDIPDLLCAAPWGAKVAADVRDGYAAGRPVAIVGHSMGGGSAISAAKSTPGLAAYVAMHPAPILSGDASLTPTAPILYTTGTADDGSIGGGSIGATAPSRAKDSYEKAAAPKALVNVKGNPHMAPTFAPGFGGLEYTAMTNWLGCFVTKDAKACAYLRDTMCNDTTAEWCYTAGLNTTAA